MRGDLRDLPDLLVLPLPVLPATSDTAIMHPRDLLKMTRWVWGFIVYAAAEHFLMLLADKFIALDE